MSTVGDTMSTPEGYHEYSGICHEYNGRYHEYTGGCSVLRGNIMSTLGTYHDDCGDIMSTVGVFSTLGGYHEHTRGCSVHQRDTMSTPRDFGKNEKKPQRNFEDFCSHTFCDYAVVYVGF